jgi:flagellar biosynthetic protein FliR
VLADLLPAQIFAFLLVFARLGAAVMLLPGIGENFVYARVRLGLALALALLILPLVQPTLPALPASPAGLAVLIVGETIYGLFIGGAARLMMASLHVAGVVIAFQSGLAYAQTIDPSQGTQGALVSTFLTILGLVLIFVTGLHGLLLDGLRDSYVLFPAGSAPPLGDFAKLATDLAAAAFTLGLQIAAPFIVFGLAFNVGLGLLQRLMPQMQLFFVAMPLQVGLALALLMITLSGSMLWFLDHFETYAVRLTGLR